MSAASPRRVLVLCLSSVALALAACGDDESDPTEGATGATGAAGVEGAPNDITVSEFIAELQPQKQEILESLVADTPKCDGVEVDDGFVLLMSAEATDADPEAPLSELVADQC